MTLKSHFDTHMTSEDALQRFIELEPYRLDRLDFYI